MAGFRIVCGRCGSENVLERSGTGRLDWASAAAVYADGLQLKCLDCSNEDFIIFRSRHEGNHGQ